jgi:hypothetical protein
VFLNDKDMNISIRTKEAFEEYEVKPYSYPVPGGNTTFNPPILTACSVLATDDQPWITDFYRPKVYKAGDSIRRRYSSLTGAFNDRTRQQSGVSIVMDDHIFKPMPNYSSFLDQFDLRLADYRLKQLASVNTAVDLLRERGIAGDYTVLTSDNRLRRDPFTGEVSPSGPSLQLPPVNSGPPPPPLGSRLNLSYSKFKQISDDFSRLKGMAAQIAISGTTWNNLTEKEQSLIKRVKKSEYILSLPTNQDPFSIQFFKENNNGKPIHRVRINSGILKMQIITVMSYSYSSVK